MRRLPAGRYLIPGDIHFPIQDDDALAALWAYSKDKVNGIIFQGDTFDGHLLSHHDKDVDRLDVSILDEYKAAAKFMARVAAQPWAGKERCKMLGGNHELPRWERLQNREPSLGRLRWTKAFGIEDDCPWLDCTEGRSWWAGPCQVTHGDKLKGSLAAVSPASTVLSNYAHQLTIFGHSHRVDLALRTAYRHGKPEMYGAYNVGHMSDVTRHGYINMGPNWQHGGAILTYNPGDTAWPVSVELLVVDNGKVRRV
jgi:hypothetical protein